MFGLRSTFLPVKFEVSLALPCDIQWKRHLKLQLQVYFIQISCIFVFIFNTESTCMPTYNNNLRVGTIGYGCFKKCEPVHWFSDCRKQSICFSNMILFH